MFKRPYFCLKHAPLKPQNAGNQAWRLLVAQDLVLGHQLDNLDQRFVEGDYRWGV